MASDNIAAYSRLRAGVCQNRMARTSPAVGRQPTASAGPPLEPSQDTIRAYAYHLYELSNYLPGHDLDNWTEAAACLRASMPARSLHSMLSQDMARSSSTKESIGGSRLSRVRVHERAQALASIAGHVRAQVTPADYEQARRELTDESDWDRPDALLDSLPEARGWDPVPGSEGHQFLKSPKEDEGHEG